MEAYSLEVKIGLDTSQLDSGLDDSSEKVSTFGDTLKANLAAGSIKDGLSTIRDGVTSLAQTAVSSWHDVDDGMDTITQKTGATGDALEAMQKSAKNIAKSIPTDFSTAGAAIGEVNTRFGLTGDALEDLSTQFVEFASLNDTDVSSSIDNVQSALAAFGLSAEDAGGMLDALNKAGQDSGASVDELSQLLVQNGTAFQSMGYSAQDSITLLSKLEKSGVDTSVVMQGMSKVQKAAMEDGVSMQDEFTQALSDSGAACDIFGAKAGPKLYQAFQNGTLSAEDFVAANADLTGSLGSVSDTYNETLDPLDKLTTAQNSLKEVLANLVDAIMPALVPLIEQFSEYISSIDLGPIQEKIASIDFESIISNLSGLFDVVSNITNFIISNADAIAAGLIAIGVGIAALKIVELAAGIASLVAAFGPLLPIIAAVIAVGTLLVANWDSIKAGAAALWEGIKTAFQAIYDVACEIFSGLATFLSGVWDGIKGVAESAWNGIKSFIIDPIVGAKDKVVEVVGNIKDKITSKFDDLKGKVETTWNNIKEKITKPITDAKEKVKEMIDKIKGFFDFKWSLPPLKMPHISISGSFSLHPLSVPKFGIEWYKKAMDEPFMFGNATLFGAGEAGDEIMYGKSNLMKDIKEAVQGTTSAPINITVYGAQGQDVSALADEVADRINQAVRRREMAHA